MENPLNVVRRQLQHASVACTGIMAGRLWIRVSAIWRGGLSGTWPLPSWRGLLRPAGVPEGFAVSNGRIEADGSYTASKIAGVIDTILVKASLFARGEVLVKTDMRVAGIATGSHRANQRGTKRRCRREALLEQPQSETRRWLINARTGLRSKTSYAFPFTGPNQGLFLRNSWMTTAPPLTAPTCPVTASSGFLLLKPL